MTIRPKPAAEVVIDAPLVRALLREQHADLAHLPLIDAGEGWDNRLFRLGDRLAVRVPRRAASAVLIEQEQRWLPRIASWLPLPVPVPLRAGRPTGAFPWSWSVVPWLTGRTALAAQPDDPLSTAAGLGRFLRALHQPAPGEAPRNPWRGVPLDSRTNLLREHLEQLNGLVDRTAVLDLWARALSAAPWPGPPSWNHGDLHPGNLLVVNGALSAVIDFGDLAAGDPATDLSIAWMLLPPPARPIFRKAARGDDDPIDDDTWMRARGWAAALGVAYLASSRDDPAFAAMGRSTVDAALMSW